MKAENGEIINSFTRLLNYIYKNMAQTINQRIDALRALLKREGIDAFINPQYRPAPKRVRSTVLEIKRMDIRLHRFGRHGGDQPATRRDCGQIPAIFSKAEQQLEGSGIDLYKEMLPETPQHPRFPAGEPYSKFSCRYRRKGIFHHTSHSPARGSGKKRHHRKEHCRPDE